MASLSTLRERTRRWIDEEETGNTHYSDSEIDGYLNEATLFLGTSMEWPLQTSTTPTVADQALYGLPTDFISLVEIYVDNKKMTIVDRSDLHALNSAWQEVDSSFPTHAYKADNATFGLWPAPDSDHADLDIQIQYINVPATLSADADVPDLHEAFQLCLPYYAAFKCEGKIGNDKKADYNFKIFETHRKALMSKIQNFSDDLKRFRWTLQ